jgi:hypothetical protein
MCGNTASRRRRHLVAYGTGTALICLSTVSTGRNRSVYVPARRVGNL